MMIIFCRFIQRNNNQNIIFYISCRQLYLLNTQRFVFCKCCPKAEYEVYFSFMKLYRKNYLPLFIIIIVLKCLDTAVLAGRNKVSKESQLEKCTPYSSSEMHASSHSYSGFPGKYSDPQALHRQCMEETDTAGLLALKVAHISGKAHSKMFFLQAWQLR